LSTDNSWHTDEIAVQQSALLAAAKWHIPFTRYETGGEKKEKPNKKKEENLGVLSPQPLPTYVH